MAEENSVMLTITPENNKKDYDINSNNHDIAYMSDSVQKQIDEHLTSLGRWGPY
jgi:hypothetical protein